MIRKPHTPGAAIQQAGIFDATVMRSRLEAPSERKTYIRRTRLIDQLAGHDTAAVVYINGIAGDGKTTLAQQWASDRRKSGHLVCWISLAQDVNGPAILASYIAAAFEAGGIRVPRRIEAILATSPVVPAQTVITLLLNAVAARDERVYLFLDDLHNVTDLETRAFMERLIRERSANLHFVVTSRAVLPWALPRLRASDDLVEISPEAVRFDKEETSAFFRELPVGEPFSAEQVRQVFKTTEGWPVALHISALAWRNAGRRHPDPSLNWNRSDLRQFFNHEILLRLPHEIRGFMLETSVLGHFDAPTSDAILGISTSRDMLEQISDLNLIQPLEPDGVSHFHPLLAGFLADELEMQNPQRRREVLLAASNYHCEQGSFVRAIEFAIEAKNVDRAADIIEQNGMELVMASRIRRLREWLSFFPEDQFAQRPRLALLRIWMLFHLPYPREALAELIKLNRRIKAEPVPVAPKVVAQRRALETEARVLVAGVFSAAGFASAARDSALRSLAFMRDKPGFFKGTLANILAFSEFASGDMSAVRSAGQLGLENHRHAGAVFGMTWSRLLLAFSELEQGDLFRAEHEIRRARDLAEKELGPGSYAESLLAVAQAELHFEWNRIDAAEQLLNAHRDIIETSAALLLIGICQIMAAKIQFAKGNRAATVDSLSAIVHAPVRAYPAATRHAAFNELSRILLLEDGFQEMQHALASLGLDALTPFDWADDDWTIARGHVEIAKCRMMIATGQHDIAIASLRRIAALAAAAECQRIGVTARRLEVIAHWGAGRQTRAVALLQDLCLDPVLGSMTRTIVDLGPDLVAPLRSLLTGLGSDRSTSHPDALKISAFCRAYLKLIPPRVDARQTGRQTAARAAKLTVGMTILEPLTNRETEIARLMANGLTNRAMSQELNVTTETIKWHLKNFFQKLGVINRTQAVIALTGRNRFLITTSPPSWVGAAIPVTARIGKTQPGGFP